MIPINRFTLCFVALAATVALAAPAYAADEDESSLPGASVVPKRKQGVVHAARQESLELPGLTACHQCEWQPRASEMPSARCGSDASGTFKKAVFECGYTPDCNRKCEFLHCVN